MAKKIYKTVSRDEINDLREFVWSQFKQLDSLVVLMDRAKLEEMEVPYNTTKDRAMSWLSSYVAGSLSAFHESQTSAAPPPPGES